MFAGFFPLSETKHKLHVGHNNNVGTKMLLSHHAVIAWLESMKRPRSNSSHVLSLVFGQFG